MAFAEDGTPFRAHVMDGDPHLMVIAGENASGKSLFFRLLALRLHADGLTPVQISIRERTGSGTYEMAEFRRHVMFGDEHEQSTGATSVRTIANAFERNLAREGGTVLLLDEPELGLSDAYAAAMGTWIGEQTRARASECAGVVVVTHSRTLVGALGAAYGQVPTFVATGATVNLDEWLTTPEVRSVLDLLALPEVGLERWRWVKAGAQAATSRGRGRQG